MSRASDHGPRSPDAAPRDAWTRRDVLRTCVGAAGGLLLAGCSAPRDAAGDSRPNVLLIVADDLGLECLGAYGGTTFATPNVDRLAADGMRFSSAFATPACAPSRAELLTGRYPFRTGWIDNAGPLSPPSLAPTEPTFARTLRDAGYATAIAGKWQLGSLRERPSMPAESGFTESCCWSLERVGKQLRMTPDNSRYFAPRLWRNGVAMGLEQDPRAYAPEVELAFLTDFVTRNRERPFLAYHALNLPHAPYHVPPGHDAPAVDDPAQRAAIHYGLMIAYMDELVGRYVRLLAELGLERRTLVLFTSDNGGNENFVVELGGRRVRGGKFTLGESGSNVPFVARQVGVVPAGATCDELVDFTDVLTTFAALGDAPLPTGATLDGHSFAAPLHGTGPTSRTWVYCQLGFAAFIRNRAWRLASDGHLFRVTGTYDDEPVDPRADASARTAYDELRGALLELLGKDVKRVKLSPALLRGEALPPAPAPDADRRSKST
jgi:arylsulfatase A